MSATMYITIAKSSLAEDPLYPPKSVWRPFKTGPRNCIGQTLAMAEIKTILVLVLRKFDRKPMYEEWDQKMGRKGMREVNGERVYQVSGGGGGPHPIDRCPCRVVRRESMTQELE